MSISTNAIRVRSVLRPNSRMVAVLVGVLSMATLAHGAEDETKKDMSNSDSKEMLKSREDSPRNGIIRQRNILERDNDSILKTFLPAISNSPDAVVELFAGDKRIALGTVVSSDGEIITKASLLTSAPKIKLSSGEEVVPKVIGLDLKEDLALLKIVGHEFEAVAWDNRVDPSVGAWVISSLPGKNIGTIGIVSVKPRKIPKERGALGIRMDNQAEGVVVSDYSTRAKQTPAERAGVKVGDKIVEVNDEPVEEILDLIRIVQGYSPGEIVVLTIERGDKTLSLEVVLDTLGLIDEASAHKETQETLGATLSLMRSGFSTAMQHDSQLEPNDCGGPVLDLEGRLVGINIARSGRVSSLTLPISFVEERLEDLRSGELSPEKVFGERIARLGDAIDRLSVEIETEIQPELDSLDDKIKEVVGEKSAAEAEVDLAQKALQELSDRLDELQSDREVLGKKIEIWHQKQQRYQDSIDALNKGFRVR